MVISSNKKKWLIRATALAVAGGLLLTLANIVRVDRASAQTTGQTAAPSVAEQSALQNVQDVMQNATTQIGATIGKIHLSQIMTNKQLKTKFAPKILPQMRKIVNQFDLFMNMYPTDAGTVRDLKYHYLGLMTLLGDKAAAGRIAAGRINADPKIVFAANLANLEVAWHRAGAITKKQSQILSDFQPLIKADPTNDDLTAVLLGFMQSPKIAPAIAKNIKTILMTEVTGPFAQELQQQHAMKMSIRRHLVSKPLIVSGKLLTGAPFSTAQWKGKVILVDFWATWCPSCRAEIPRIVKLYKKYHGGGLEVLGVSSDNSAGKLRSFLSATPGIVWPQLFDYKHPGLNAVNKRLNIRIFPTLVLIGRDGVVQDVDPMSLKIKVRHLLKS